MAGPQVHHVELSNVSPKSQVAFMEKNYKFRDPRTGNMEQANRSSSRKTPIYLLHESHYSPASLSINLSAIYIPQNILFISWKK